PRSEVAPVAGRVISVGRLLARKGYDQLIRAVAQVARSYRPAHLVLVGTGPEEHGLHVLAAELGISSLVTFAGNVPRADLPNLLHSAEVFCYPTRWDSVPVAILEAMACGLPTVVSAVGALPDIVGGTGIVNPAGDVAGLA